MKSVFLGSKQLGLEIFSKIYHCAPNDWIIIHPDDSEGPRSCLEDFRRFAKKEGVPFFLVSNNKEAQEVLCAIQPDIGLVCGWYWIIREDVIDAVGRGLWGVHNSLLPKYRGGSPLVWSIINGDKEVGASVFRLTKGMDDGEILYQARVFLEESRDINYALSEIEKCLLRGLPEKWKDLISGEAILMQQNHQDATFCAARTASDGAIEWAWPAEQIHNFIRAQAFPYPGAFFFMEGEKISIQKSRVFDGVYYGTPGQVAFVSGHEVIVSCGEATALVIEEVELDGRREKASKILRSVKIRLKS